MTLALSKAIFPFHSFSACSRSCQNGGTRDDGACTCVCAENHSGDSCESELVRGLTDTMRHVHEISKIKWECTCVCMFIILSGPAFTFEGDCSKYLCAAMLRDFPKFANLEHPMFNRNSIFAEGYNARIIRLCNAVETHSVS